MSYATDVRPASRGEFPLTFAVADAHDDVIGGREFEVVDGALAMTFMASFPAGSPLRRYAARLGRDDALAAHALENYLLPLRSSDPESREMNRSWPS